MTALPPAFELAPDNAQCLVLTEKDGLLSSVAHDLKIEVTDFRIHWDGATIDASFSPRSLRVLSAMRGVREDHDALDESGQKEIEQSILDDVLEVKKHRKIGFRSSEVSAAEKGFRIEGELTLHGVSLPVSARLARRDQRWSCEVSIDQRDHGIRPYSAMLGTLKVKPEVRVRISFSADDLPLE